MTPLALFGSFGFQELIIVLLIVVFLFGARRIPEIARGVKKAAPKTPEERLAGIVSTDSRPTASSSEIDEANIPDHYKRQLEHIRALKGGAGPSGIGLSFANPSRNKK